MEKGYNNNWGYNKIFEYVYTNYYPVGAGKEDRL
jgi:hypothetical protein